MFSRLCQIILGWLGWGIEGQYPEAVDKCVIVVMPHTSNWDFPLGILVRSAVKGQGNFVAKDTIFKWPYGWLFRWLGGIPVNRAKSQNFVKGVVQQFKKRQKLKLIIAPEGTRKKVTKLKTGFYFIAVKAGVPIVLCKFDYKQKVVGFSEPFWPQGDVSADFKKMYEFYKDAEGYHRDAGIDAKLFLIE